MTDIRRYLDNDTLVKIGRLDIIARLVVEGIITGLHKSPYHGFSVEFAEHREYVVGDDIRHIDWKVYGKSDRYYVKQYEEETDLHAYILLDISESMRFPLPADQWNEPPEGKISKLLYATYAAAALSHLILQQQDSVGLCLFDDAIEKFIPAGSSASHLRFLIHEIDQIEPRAKTDLGGILHSCAERIKKKGLVILISDLLTDPEELLHGLRHLRHRRHEVILLHIMDHEELTFPYDRMTKFVGMEEAPEMLCNPRALRKAYLKELDSFMETVKRGCRKDRIDYVLMDTEKPLDVALSRFLATRAEMKLK